MAGLRTAMPGTCSTVTVLSLAVSRYVGAPPLRRLVPSRAAITDGDVLSLIASTTRNRDHANHATNNVVRAPSMTGPSPKSYWTHIPGSVTHGRCTRTVSYTHLTL